MGTRIGSRHNREDYPNLRKFKKIKIDKVAAEVNGSETGKGKYMVEIRTKFVYRVNWKTKREAIAHVKLLTKRGLNVELING